MRWSTLPTDPDQPPAPAGSLARRVRRRASLACMITDTSRWRCSYSSRSPGVRKTSCSAPSDESEFDRGRPAREDEEEEDDAAPPETSRSDIAFAPPPCRTELTS